MGNAAVAGLVAGIAISLAGCSKSMSTPLPDIASKSALPPGAPPPLTVPEQKKAIDSMIAKRDALEKSQPK